VTVAYTTSRGVTGRQPPDAAISNACIATPSNASPTSTDPTRPTMGRPIDLRGCAIARLSRGRLRSGRTGIFRPTRRPRRARTQPYARSLWTRLVMPCSAVPRACHTTRTIEVVPGRSVRVGAQLNPPSPVGPHGLQAGGRGRASSCQIAHGTERTSGHPRSTSRVAAGPGRGTGASALPKLTMRVRFPSPARSDL
jgi:hypothetical protein